MHRDVHCVCILFQDRLLLLCLMGILSLAHPTEKKLEAGLQCSRSMFKFNEQIENGM